MELDLGLKLSKVIDEFSSADFQFAKDRAGPAFVSSETDDMFILSAHLKGYNRGNVKIDINEDGTQIAITGEKKVQQTIIVGRQVYKKGVEIKGFRKAFKIPDEVVLDKIKAKFNDDESVLTITMPKVVKGIRGIGIDEVKEQEIAREGSGTVQIADDEASQAESSQADEKANDIYKTESGNEAKVTYPEQTKSGSNQLAQNAEFRSVPSSDKAPFVEKPVTQAEKLDKQEIGQDIQEKTKSRYDHGDFSCSKKLHDQHQHSNDQADHGDQGKTDDNKEVEKQSAVVKHAQENQEGEFAKRKEAEAPERRGVICAPVVAGSAILISLVVFAFHFIRNKNQTDRRRS